jgi:hypothetical protein
MNDENIVNYNVNFAKYRNIVGNCNVIIKYIYYYILDNHSDKKLFRIKVNCLNAIEMSKAAKNLKDGFKFRDAEQSEFLSCGARYYLSDIPVYDDPEIQYDEVIFSYL